jgi:hypothetical protein
MQNRRMRGERKVRRNRASRPIPGEPRLSARAELVTDQDVLNQRGEHGFVQPRESHQTRIETPQLCLRERVEIHTRRRLGRAHRLPPAQQDFGVACRVDGALA